MGFRSRQAAKAVFYKYACHSFDANKEYVNGTRIASNLHTHDNNSYHNAPLTRLALHSHSLRCVYVKQDDAAFRHGIGPTVTRPTVVDLSTVTLVSSKSPSVGLTKLA